MAPHTPTQKALDAAMATLRQGAHALWEATPFHRLDVLGLLWQDGKGAWAEHNANPMADHSAHARLQRLDALQPLLEAWDVMARTLHATPALGPVMDSGGTPLLRLLRNTNGFSLHLGAFGTRSATTPWQDSVLGGPWNRTIDAVLEPMAAALRLEPTPPRTLRFTETTTGGVVGAGEVPANVVEALWPCFTRPPRPTSNGTTIPYPMATWRPGPLPVDRCTARVCEVPMPIGGDAGGPTAHDSTLRLSLDRATHKGQEERAVLDQILALQQQVWGTQLYWIPTENTDVTALIRHL